MSVQLQDPSLVMTRALILIRSQIVRVKEFPSRFDDLWNDATKSLSTLQVDILNAASLVHRTRSNKKGTQKEVLRLEFVNTCNIIADDMAARFGTMDHDVIAQGLEALLPGSDTLLDPQSIIPFAKLFRIAENTTLLTAQLETALSMIKHEKPAIYSLMHLGDYLLTFRVAFSLVLECIAVAITIPVSSSSAERSFSAVKRILTRLRTSMTDVRLSDLTILSTHRYQLVHKNSRFDFLSSLLVYWPTHWMKMRLSHAFLDFVHGDLVENDYASS